MEYADIMTFLRSTNKIIEQFNTDTLEAIFDDISDVAEIVEMTADEEKDFETELEKIKAQIERG